MSIPIENLEISEFVNLYFINETQRVIELDSPSIGAETLIAEKTAIYKFFPTQRVAEGYLEGLKQKYVQEKPLLQTDQRNSHRLYGKTTHRFSHSYDIRFIINKKTISLEDLTEDIKELLSQPKRRIISDREFEVQKFHPYPDDPEPPYNLNLF